MPRIAFIFPGQASQYVGMGKELAATPIGAEYFARADQVLGFPLSRLCFNGPEEDLTRTDNCQPAIVTVSLIVFELLNERGIVPELTAGHSLGEYSALAAARALTFTEAVRLVRLRGQLMDRAARTAPGCGMGAVVGLPPADVEAICREASAAGIVEAANYNSPVQTAISGERAGLEKALELAKEWGAKRALMLPVSAPFHCRLMDPVAEEFSRELEEAAIGDAAFPVVANVTARPESRASEIRENLIAQVNGPVRWTEIVEYMIGRGIDTFVEVGPGKVLSGLVKKTSREVACHPVETPESIEALAAALA